MPTIKSRIGTLLLPALPTSRQSFDVARLQMTAALLPFANAISLKYWKERRRIFNLNAPLSINFGSGGTGLPGWINTDIRYHNDTNIRVNISRRLPFRDGSARRIRAEHVVEHLEFKEHVPFFLREARRILVDKGTLRIIVPDAKRYVEAYISGDPHLWEQLGIPLETFPADMPTKMAMVNHVFHQGGEHFFGYDFETLAYVLAEAGFTEIVHQSFGVSVDKELEADQKHHAPYSLYVDAIR